MEVCTNGQPVKYSFDRKYRFVVENYNWAKPFSNFFHGIGGKWGIPIWAFYVNRNQCVGSFGLKDKNNAITEFHSFNRALQFIAHDGFRTFLKTDNGLLYEPFQKVSDKEIRQKLVASSHELEVYELNPKLGIETSICYFPLIGEPVGALIRCLKLLNVRDVPLNIEMIDGLPSILPYGMDHNLVKFIPRHIEGMMEVNDFSGVPVCTLKQSPEDVCRVESIRGGNFYLSILEGNSTILDKHFIVDPYLVFGESEAHDYPWQFMASSVQELLAMKQVKENKTPCAFTALPVTLPANGAIILYSVIGHTQNEREMNNLLTSISNNDFFTSKRSENQTTIDSIKNQAFTVSSSRRFDHYCQQTYLDNALRGGLPQVFDTREGKSVFYLYSRKHGDMERDYNFFTLDPTYLSQGDGHYRDVNQNRRSDVWFCPQIDDTNIINFLSLIQLDGYNPLIVTRLTYTAENSPRLEKWLRGLAKNDVLYGELLALVTRPFTPGEFIMRLEQETERDCNEYDRVLGELLRFCRQNDLGDLHEGFWVDHWTYNLDLIERFLEIYPERLKEILVDRREYWFYDNPDIVLPRDQKYVLVDGQVRQYDSVVRDQAKAKMIIGRAELLTRVRTQYGSGPIYKTDLLVKLLSIVVNKIATLDPQGIGIMMEADKPGWCDPLNGLPGLFGSSICETLELERLCRFLLHSLDGIGIADNQPVPVYEELYEFMTAVHVAIGKRLNSKDEAKTFTYWDGSNRAKEAYREQTKMGISGVERNTALSQFKTFLNDCLNLTIEATGPDNHAMLFNKDGVCNTYFVNTVTAYEPVWANKKKKVPAISHTGYPLVRVKNFRSQPVPLFLEGPVHLLRVHPATNSSIYSSVRKSKLFDRMLKMYVNNESLEDAPFEIGRIRAYASGWIENGSVYLHMEYKWLLELLRSGLCREFYRDIKSALVPFLDPAVYGRSTLEGSSFIVSCDFPDEKLHGRGFQPRLSGKTSEMIHMWTLIVAGQQPFSLDDKGRLKLRLCPTLPGWIFTRKKNTCQYFTGDGKEVSLTIPANAFAFKFLGKTLVVYHNPDRKDTFGDGAVKPTSYQLTYADGKNARVADDTLDAGRALDVRSGLVDRIDIILS